MEGRRIENCVSRLVQAQRLPDRSEYSTSFFIRQMVRKYPTPTDERGSPMGTSKSFLYEPIRTTSGLIAGLPVDENRDIYTFKGIPYADPPVGDLRWRPPQPMTPWDGVKESHQYGYSCPQPEMMAPYGRNFGEQREDCLYLNIWTAAMDPEEKRPVMVWIHGGGFYQGSGSTESYDGAALALKGVILVTINYRLGPFGFLAHPGLSEESDRHISGNYGLLDQVAALQWIQDNIRAFGGDPERVLIFGESGGARSVCFLMATPLSKGLFSRAAVQSGSLYRPIGHLKEPRQGLAALESQGESFARKLGCRNLAALRATCAEDVLKTANPKTGSFITPPLHAPPAADTGMVIGPCIDGWVIPEDPVMIYRRGKQHDVPMIIGSNKDEMSMFLGPFRKMGVRQFEGFIESSFPDHSHSILKLYPVTEDADVRATLNRLMTELTWTRPTRATARDMSSVASKIYLYFLTQHRPGDSGQFGTFHGVDIRYVFGHNLGARLPMSDEEWVLSDKMQAYWINFAANGDPNGSGLPKWPAYIKNTNPVLELGPEIRVLTDLYKQSSDMFDGIDQDRRRR